MRIATLALLLTTLGARAEEESVDQPTPWIVDHKVLSCSPTTLKAGQSLTLTLGAGHGKELAIEGPEKDKVFVLVVEDMEACGPQLMSTQQFKAANSVVVPTDFMSRPFVMNASIERVFTKRGIYRITVSEELASELGGHLCTVRYTG